MLTYAIGDVHGRLDLLIELLGRIEADAGGMAARLVFLGDYIDRGPDSAGVIARVRELQAASPDQVVCLKGNHEDLLLKALHDPALFENWLMNGADATLDSFGVGRTADLPRAVTDWIETCPTSFEDARHVYVHAGLHPARERTRQRDHDRLWIRDAFLEGEHDFGKYVVHGHTPQRSGWPDLRRFRVNLDTAAVYGGRLTAGVFSDETDPPIAFLHAPSTPIGGQRRREPG